MTFLSLLVWCYAQSPPGRTVSNKYSLVFDFNVPSTAQDESHSKSFPYQFHTHHRITSKKLVHSSDTLHSQQQTQPCQNHQQSAYLNIYISVFSLLYNLQKYCPMLHDVCSRKSKTVHQITSICLIHRCDTQCDNNTCCGDHLHSAGTRQKELASIC